MKTYVVSTVIEMEADDAEQAEELVLGLDVVDINGDTIPCYVEVTEVKELEE